MAPRQDQLIDRATAELAKPSKGRAQRLFASGATPETTGEADRADDSELRVAEPMVTTAKDLRDAMARLGAETEQTGLAALETTLDAVRANAEGKSSGTVAKKLRALANKLARATLDLETSTR
jgi:hypothetical protein